MWIDRDADQIGAERRRVQLDIVCVLLWISGLELAQLIPAGATADRKVSQRVCVYLGRSVDVPCGFKELWRLDGHEVLLGESPCIIIPCVATAKRK